VPGEGLEPPMYVRQMEWLNCCYHPKTCAGALCHSRRPFGQESNLHPGKTFTSKFGANVGNQTLTNRQNVLASSTENWVDQLSPSWEPCALHYIDKSGYRPIHAGDCGRCPTKLDDPAGSSPIGTGIEPVLAAWGWNDAVSIQN